MSDRRNILFIMTDQLCARSLGCAGHPLVHTPNIDRLAARGVRFDAAYTTSALCVPARASLATGRYVQSHRVWTNEVPWPADERLMGHYLDDIGVRAFQCGKSHYTPDYYTGAPEPAISMKMANGRMSPFPDMTTLEYNDGFNLNVDYRAYLHDRGYPPDVVDIPHHFVRPDGTLVVANTCVPGLASDLPCVLDADDTDTAFTSKQALRFLEEEHPDPWMLYLSYYRPHHPYCPSPPYFRMYDPREVPPPRRTDDELRTAHPLVRAQRQLCAEIMHDDAHVRWMRSAYYGLITEIDDWVGKVLGVLDARGLLESTLIIFSSDHGDYLFDHWLFGKNSLYDQAYRIPLIVVDPSADADAARGSVSDAPVQIIDILPTMLEWRGAEIPAAIEGRSLLPLARGGTPAEWRDAVFAAWDYQAFAPESCRRAGATRGFNVRDAAVNYWYFPGLDDVLFDLRADPDEFVNVARDPAYKRVIDDCRGRLLDHLAIFTDRRRLDWRCDPSRQA